jgi:MSHA pilin protein MshC
MKNHGGFTLVELVTVVILIGVLSLALFSRLSVISSAAVQGSRDDLIAALSFAQQTAMMRSDISVVITGNSVSVNENSIPIKVSSNFYPLEMPKGVGLSTDVTDNTFIYDKLGRSNAGIITITGSGNSAGVSAKINVDVSGYAFTK